MTYARQELGASAIQDHISTTDSTHGSAPEASAARLIRLLRSVYPGLEPINAAQDALVAYLEAKIGGLEPNLADVSGYPQIATTLQLIHHIERRTTISTADKIKIWKQMVSIANTYPTKCWKNRDAKWSSNRIYNPETRTEDIVTASPAETMNLVCTAILDTPRYLCSDSGDEADLGFRVESFYTRLYDLQSQEDAGNLRLCAAGRQHEMLFILNDAYLDKKRDEPGALPIQLIQSTPTFLVESLSSYIEAKLSRIDPRERAQVVLDSIRWQAGLIEGEEYPLIRWLTTCTEGHWASGCLDYLAQRCLAFGINPAHCKLEDTMTGLPYMTLPASSQMLEPLIDVIIKTSPFKRREETRGVATDRIDSWNALIIAANAALGILQSALTPDTCENHAQLIRDFYKTLDVMQSLNHYKEMIMLVGEEDGEFNRAKEDVQRQLLTYYNSFSLQRRLPDEFEAPLQRYLTQQKAFSKRSQIDFVENSFADLFAGNNFYAWWNRLQALRPAGTAEHPLTLTDERLARWYSDAIVEGSDGAELIMEITPYEINRILLHALLVAPRQWTQRYAESLQLVTEWLLKPKQSDQGLLNSLKKVYKKSHILSNLLLLSLLNRPSFTEDGIKQRNNNFWVRKLELFNNRHLLENIIFQNTPEETTAMLITLQDKLRHFISNSSHLDQVLSLKKLNHEHRTQILSALNAQLAQIIPNVDALRSLLALPGSELNTEHRTHILTALQGRLGEIIPDLKALHSVLERPEAELNANQRTLIWTALKDRFGIMMKSVGMLANFLTLPTSALNHEQRTDLLTAIKEPLDMQLSDITSLIWLFELPDSQLNTEHRTLIWSLVQGRLGRLMQRGSERLLELSTSQLNNAQRNEILRAEIGRLSHSSYGVYPLRQLLYVYISQLSSERRNEILMALPGLIKNKNDLYDLFTLPDHCLKAEHRTQILKDLEGRLDDIIPNLDTLKSLFELRELELDSSHRAYILTKLQRHFTHWINSGYDLRFLFRLPESQLNTTQRALIWKVAQQKPEVFFQDGLVLCSLLVLNESQLTTSQRAQVWATIQARLGEFIQDKSVLGLLLRLCESQLDLEQRRQVWLALQAGLGTLITNIDDLILLLNRPESALDADQRTQILMALRTLWVRIVPNINELINLLEVDHTQLRAEHRTELLTGIQGQLSGLIKNGYDLIQILKLPEAKLNAEHRTQILNAIEGDLTRLIRGEDDLIQIFRHPLSQLSTDHRSQILKVLIRNRVELIKTGDHDRRLFALSETQLNAEHRALIVEAATMIAPKVVGFFSKTAKASPAELMNLVGNAM